MINDSRELSKSEEEGLRNHEVLMSKHIRKGRKEDPVEEDRQQTITIDYLSRISKLHKSTNVFFASLQEKQNI